MSFSFQLIRQTMNAPVSHYLELRERGRDYRFRSPQALRTLLGLSPPYDTCLAYAPYARNAPHCSQPVNRAKAASVAGLLDRLRTARIPSIAAEGLLKTLSAQAVCGITGWHQNKAFEVYIGWQHDLWEECLRANGLDPRQWAGPAPSMLGWDRGIELARQEQGWETEEVADDDSSEEDYTEEEEEYSDEDDSGDDDVVSVSEGSITDSDAASDFDGQEDISFDIEDSNSSSSDEIVVLTPDTTISDFDGDSPDFYTPSASSQPTGDSQITTPSHSSVPTPLISPHHPGTDTQSTPDLAHDPPAAASAGDTAAMSPDEPEVQDDDDDDDVGSSSQPSELFPSHLLSIDVDVLQTPDTTTTNPTSPPDAILPAGFRLYPQATTPLSQLKQLLNLLTQTVSPQRRYPGILYGFSRPSAAGMLKIGVVKDDGVVARRRPFADPVEHRLAVWQAQCGHPVVEVFRQRIACAPAERIESLVHLALREYRRVEDPPCGRCERRKRRARGRCSGGGRHDEWFEVDVGTVMRVVETWAVFAEQLPYDGFGRLVDFWSEKVDAAKAGVEDGDTVEGWLEGIPGLVEEGRRRELVDMVGRFYFSKQESGF